MRSRFSQLGFAATAIPPAVLAIGFAAQMSWAASTWPFETARLSNFFLGSILAAIAVPVLWVNARREWGALRSSALFPFLMLAAMAIYLIEEDLAGDDSGLLPFAGAMTFGAVYALALMLAGGRVPLQDRRPIPLLVRASFAVFALVLVTAGLALVLGADNIMPWPASDESLVMFGFIFLGAASSYVYGTLRPMWGYVYAPLLGFLAYDLVLLPPLLDHFSDVAPEHHTSLIVYVAVLVYSGALATYYLVIRRSTRLWGRVRPPASA
jgi:hypothetical protein